MSNEQKQTVSGITPKALEWRIDRTKGALELGFPKEGIAPLFLIKEDKGGFLLLGIVIPESEQPLPPFSTIEQAKDEAERFWSQTQQAIQLEEESGRRGKREAEGKPSFSFIGTEKELAAILAEAMQDAWNDFTQETGRYPDCFSIQQSGGNEPFLFADFDEISGGAKFVRKVAEFARQTIQHGQ